MAHAVHYSPYSAKFHPPLQDSPGTPFVRSPGRSKYRVRFGPDCDEIPGMAGTADLPRRIGFWGGSALMVGNIIGSGIFQSPVSIAQELGSPAVILALWVAGGLLSLCGALAYAELASMLPRSGGMYVYLNEGWGAPLAFTFGWTYLLLIKPFAAAAIAMTFAAHVNALLGTRLNEPVVACGMLAVLTGINSATLRGSSAIAIGLTSLKVLALVGLVLLGAGLWKGSAANFGGAPAPKPLAFALAPAMYGILWTYDGWVDVVSVAGEVEHPGRNLPLILLAGTAATIFLYLAVNVVYFSLVPLVEMRGAETVAPLVMDRLLGKGGSTAVTAMIVVSTLGASHGAILTGARVTFAQARDGLLFRFLGHVGPGAQTPDVSLWTQALLSCGAVLYLRHFKDLSEGYGFMMWIFYAFSAAAVILLRIRQPGLDRPYRCWGYPWVPLVFIAASIVMTLLYLAQNPRTTLPWLGVLFGGLPMYWLWTRLSRRRTREGAASPELEPGPAREGSRESGEPRGRAR
jgi:APA family basic amino acid/polyamine antiporter